MNLGFTGHQSRPGLQWSWVRDQLVAVLQQLPGPCDAYSSLAVGADQLFAEEVLRAGHSLNAVIPYVTYEHTFEPQDIARYRSLLAKSKEVALNLPFSGEKAFYEAGKWIVDHSDLMIAVWDGKPSQGFGGTGDIVAYAIDAGAPIVHINTTSRNVVWGTKR